MNWEALGSVGEFVGAIGVIASLIYLAVQIRQNTRSLRAGTYESLSQATAASNTLLMSDPEFARIVEIGLGSEPLPPEDLARFTAYLRMSFRRYDSIFLHYRQGTLPTDAWQAYWNSFRRILQSTNVQRYWERRKEDYTPDFQQLVSEEVTRIRDSDAA